MYTVYTNNTVVAHVSTFASALEIVAREMINYPLAAIYIEGPNGETYN